MERVEGQAQRLLGKGLGALLKANQEVPNVLHRHSRPYTGRYQIYIIFLLV